MAMPVRKVDTDNVIKLEMIDGRLSKKQNFHYKKDGSVDKRYNNRGYKVAGVSSEVYPFNEKEIDAMINVFNKHIEQAPDDNKLQIACRNKMLFLIGINVGLRASDLVILRYSHLLNDDGSFKDFFTLKPKKTQKTGKFVKPFINEVVKKAVANYINDYPIKDMEEFLFKSRVGDSHITEVYLGKIIKNAAAEAGIEKSINSHSLRKTFGRFIWHNANDKNKALILLQKIFNHTSPAITSKYIGITDDEMSDVYNSLDLGLDYL